MSDLTGRQVERLQKALLASYDLPKLTALVAFKFQPPEGVESVPPIGPLAQFTAPPFTNQVLQLIEKAEQEGWTDALVRDAYLYVPGNAKLRAFYADYFGSVQRQAPGHALQRIVDDSNSNLQPAVWRERLARLEATVCCIEIDGKPCGTGVLVAPSIVLTNYHVVEDVVDGLVKREAVGCRFDYKRLGSNVLNAGVVHPLAPDWYLAGSPPSPVDSVVDPASLQPPDAGSPKVPEAQSNELDYALLSLASQAGSDIVAGQARGHVLPPLPRNEFVRGTALNILQHPDGRPLELALGPTGLIRCNNAATRITYRTNTEYGSSGSPCFDKDWNLVALHHSGDPDLKRSPAYNEGIPVNALRADLPPGLRSQLGW